MIDVGTIENIVCEHFNVPVEKLRSSDKTRKVCDARHYVWYFLFEAMGYKCATIAEWYGVTKRNVFHSNSCMKDGIRYQRFFRDNYLQIASKLMEKEEII